LFDRNKVIGALEQKRHEFQEFRQSQVAQRDQLEDWLQQFYGYDAATIQAAIDARGIAWPGALPTSELDNAEALCLAFPHQWQDHRNARNWALDILLNRPVLAVDGSQIAPTKDLSPAVGAIQIGWFLNEHTASRGGYVKDIEFEILSPKMLSEEEGDDSGGSFANQTVNRIRFEREVSKLCELMEQYADAPTQQKPLCFFDGSFIVSFAGTMKPEHARPYTRAVQTLLDCSTRFEVPLVAYIDRSFSRDIIMLMSALQGEAAMMPVSDAALIARCVEKWGDRSPLFICARNDALSQNNQATFYQDVLFTYIKVSTDAPPARIEMPRWIHDAGRTEEILNIVRAECIVGANGYPYAVETADATAVITMQERQRFYALYQQFVEREGLALQQTRKAQSKLNRR